MQLFCVYSTGDGKLIAAASRAPDLLRREIAARTGTRTILLWCSVPPAQLNAHHLVQRFEREFAAALSSRSRLVQNAALLRLAFVDPALSEVRQRIGGRWMRTGRMAARLLGRH